MSIWWLLQRLAMDRMAAGLYLWPCSVMTWAWIGTRLGVGAQGADEALDAVRGHALDDALHDERRAAVAQMIDHMEDANLHFTFA